MAEEEKPSTSLAVVEQPKELKHPFRCDACKKTFLRAQNPCTCGRWNTISSSSFRKSGHGIATTSGPERVEDILTEEAKDEHRFPTGTREFDRVLGGGIVMGSIILLSGEPGQGKSTLAHTVAAELADGVEEGPNADPNDPFTALYISGEESKKQITDRGKRICHDSKSLMLMIETDIEKIVDALIEKRPDLAVIDSLQKMELKGESNTPNVLKEIVTRLVRTCKREDLEISLIIVAHVTKDGNIAGPKYVEHLVDAVLSFEGEDRSNEIRVLRSFKNRFGATSQVGIFRMTETGLTSEDDPTKFLLRGKSGAPGSALGCAMVAAGKGSSSRPMIVEAQALLSSGGKKAVHVAQGYSEKRLSVLLAVLQKFVPASYGLAYQDIYLNIPTSLKVEDEASLDLPVAMALLSAYYNAPLPKGSIYWGEVGLMEEIRPESEIATRVSLSETLGYKAVVCSKSTTEILTVSAVATMIAPKEGSLALRFADMAQRLNGESSEEHG